MTSTTYPAATHTNHQTFAGKDAVLIDGTMWHRNGVTVDGTDRYDCIENREVTERTLAELERERGGTHGWTAFKLVTGDNPLDETLVLANQRCDSLTDRVADLQRQLTHEQNIHQAFREQVRSTAVEYALEHDWCSVVSDALDQLGLDSRIQTEETFRVTATWEVTASTTSWDALNAIRDGSVCSFLQDSLTMADPELDYDWKDQGFSSPDIEVDLL